jgi:glycosyltransferase involved in cell wall biosynthesis/GT2 family glycosyltransferase
VEVVASHDWLTAIAAREIARALEAPLVVTFHDEINGKRFGRLDREALYVRDLEALTAHDATRVIANSRFLAGQIVRHYGVDQERVAAIPGGIDPGLLDLRRSESRVKDFRSVLAAPEDVLVTYVGRLDPEKGLPVLGQAARAACAGCSALRFAVAGTGPEEPALSEALAPLGDRAKLLGYVKGETLSLLYRASDVVVVPSLYEPFGLVALEGMLAGASVVTSDAGGLAEIVRHGEDGLVVPAGDPAALAAALVRLSADPTLRRRLGEVARQRVRQEFAWSEIARRTERVYETAIGASRSILTTPPTTPTPSLAPPPVSIVVVSWDGLSLTREAVESVLSNTHAPFELVLVDNGSRDGTLAFFHEVRDRLGPDVVQVIKNDENRGYAIAANQAIRATRGRDIVLLNNDARVRPGWLDALLETSRSQADVGMVTAKVLNEDLTVQSAGGILHSPDGSFTIPGQGEDRLAPTVTGRREVENAGGPCLLLTRALIEKVGAFDEAYSPAYFEDSDLCLRAREKGLKLLYEPLAEVVHKGKATANRIAREGWLDVWGSFERNKGRFHERWSSRLAADESTRRASADKPQRLRVLLCYGKSMTTTAAYVESALRAEHEVVTAGPGQDIDLGETATASDLVREAGHSDLLLVVEGVNYFPRELEGASCSTAFWAIDNHLHATDRDGWHFDAARAFDNVFVAQRDFIPAFRARGVEATWLPLACDPRVHVQQVPERDLDVVFVGNVLPIHRRRRVLLDRLKARFRVAEVQGAWREDMGRLHARAKVVFNCSLAGDLNMRVFEALASGALLVTDRIENGLGELFGDGEHLALYDDATLEEVVARAIEDDTLRREIGGRGQRLALKHHTYGHRMRALCRVMATSSRRPRLAEVPS